MSQLAVIGSDTFGQGFRLAGIKRIAVAEELADLEAAVNAAIQDGEISILIMHTSDVGRLDPRTRSHLVASVKPTLVAVGAEEDNTLREKIKQAVGVDLW